MRRIAQKVTLSVTVLLFVGVGCRTMPKMAQVSPTGGPMIGYSYRGGAASQSYNSAEPEVLEATLAAMEDLSMQVSRDPHRTGTATTLVARAADGRKVRVDLKAQGTGTTATVAVGLVGDEPLSKALLDRVGIRLGSLPPEAIPSEIPTSDESSNPVLSREGVPDSVMYRGFTDSDFQDSPVP